MNIIQSLERDKKLMIKVIAGILLLVIAFVFYLVKNTGKTDLTLSDFPQEETEISQTTESQLTSGSGLVEEQTIFIDIAGAVARPSVVELPAGSRVFEAIEKAGGLTGEADVRWTNQAEILADGQKIYIPTKQELEEGSTDAAAPGFSRPATISGKGLVNINTADSETLQQLPGIGPATADKIINYRNENGAFQSIEEITDVSGIGEKTFTKFKDKITI